MIPTLVISVMAIHVIAMMIPGPTFVVVARVFSFGPARQGYVKLKKLIDRLFGGLIAIFGVKIATT